MSIGAWKGLIQLAGGKAYKWEKTAHGTSILTEEKIRQEPENFARQVRWIEVKEPEVRNGKTHMTVPQLAFSIGFTICLVLFALIIVGIVPFAPISDHVKITTVPGLSQALSPWSQIKAGEEPRLLNYEAIPKPNKDARAVTLVSSEKPGVKLREKQEIKSSQEPGLSLVYDPEINLIQIRAEGTDPTTPDSTRVYEVKMTSAEGVSSYRIDSTPATLTIPGGKTSAEIQINRTYESGARVPALQCTV